MNKVTLIGHLGRDPEMRYTSTGQAVTSFSVATSYGQGDKKETQWFNCSAWEKQAGLCNQYLQKGSQVYIEGRIRSRAYEGWTVRPDSPLDVSVNQVEFLGSSKSGTADVIEDAV
jgi:single-strand DNA-binding protein